MKEPIRPPPPVDDAASRDRRQRLGQQAVMALCGLLRAARSHGWEHEVFAPLLDLLQRAILELLSTDGAFLLEPTEDGFQVNGEAVRLEAMAVPLASALRTELRRRGVTGIRSALAPPTTDLRLLLRLFRPAPPPRLEERGDPARPFEVLTLRLGAQAGPAATPAQRTTRLAEAYAEAASFVNHTIQQLRVGGGPLPLRLASGVVRDLVDLQRSMPMRFLALARVTAEEGERYWGVHAANVAVLAVGFGARLGLSKERRHDLGMAALFHDVGMAAIPKTVLQNPGKLDERGQRALKASPLLAARAILRDREVHLAALERAQAATSAISTWCRPTGRCRRSGCRGGSSPSANRSTRSPARARSARPGRRARRCAS